MAAKQSWETFEAARDGICYLQKTKDKSYQRFLIKTCAGQKKMKHSLENKNKAIKLPRILCLTEPSLKIKVK